MYVIVHFYLCTSYMYVREFGIVCAIKKCVCYTEVLFGSSLKIAAFGRKTLTPPNFHQNSTYPPLIKRQSLRPPLIELIMFCTPLEHQNNFKKTPPKTGIFQGDPP